MARTATVLTPAKVNLVLRVVGKLDGGYHELESLMVPISLYDELRLTVSPAASTTRVRCKVEGPERIGVDSNNLAVIATRAVLDELSVAAIVDITIAKFIPCGAGLGGGSSDAAAVMNLLPSLVGRRIPPNRKSEMALELGSDVPFFLRCRPAFARGRGERLTPLPGLPPLHFLVVVPERRVSTAWAFENALEGLTSRGAGTNLLRLLVGGKPLHSLLANDFEKGVGEAVPETTEARELLVSLGAIGAVLSGTGSAVVGLFESAAASRAAAKHFAAPYRVYTAGLLKGRPRRRR
ncbi:MAG: 4-(cytidine 5'-diphospho)-2-C-methyl-D-erythritol kinase [Candidatus Binatia bacterium]